MLKSVLIRIGIVLAGILIVVVGRSLFFYQGLSASSPGEMPAYQNITVPTVPTAEFSDNYEKGEGTILIDLAHRNAFNKEELNVLILRLVSRGLTIKFFTDGDDLEKELLAAQDEEENEPEEELKMPDAFIVISPTSEFSREEVKATANFTSQGGKLLLIADPTRPSQINSLALESGLVFESDYLYNMEENDANYRNIFVSEFEENELTEGLEKIALYTAGSISSAESSLAFVDGNTFSNLLATGQKLSPVALVEKSNVLAIYDLTFMTEPYNGILDNNQFISNIADWLMSPGEKRELK